uniref:Integrase n=1 Tax=Steinernema glaseri TaxID=37863 RepID=A0A1I8AFC9_9BILA
MSMNDKITTPVVSKVGTKGGKLVLRCFFHDAALSFVRVRRHQKNWFLRVTWSKVKNKHPVVSSVLFTDCAPLMAHEW